MSQETVLVSERIKVPTWIDVDHDEEEILRALTRAAEDNRFIARLTTEGSETLRDYGLTTEAKAALISGDIRWIEARVGKLDAPLRTWLDCRLQQENW
ncbi:MAG: hypothetical protein MUQ10_06395 [Anaerolineae bacterium]|nr:hypothetical protein [Anaerolineae bacterium]